MVFQHAVLAAEVTFAKVAVPNNALCDFLAVGEGAAELLGWHSVALVWARSGDVEVIREKPTAEGETFVICL